MNSTHLSIIFFKKFHFCKILLDYIPDIGTLHSIWSKYVDEFSIVFEWKLNCVDKDIVSAYNVQYCVVVDFDNNLCLENHFNEIFNASNVIYNSNLYEIKNLKPYRKYKISIALISTSGHVGAFSKPIFVKTLEGCEYISVVHVLTKGSQTKNFHLNFSSH